MQGPIWEWQEPGQAPVSLQDLIGPGAGGTGHCSVLRPHSWPGIHMERIAGNQSRSYPTFNCSTAQGRAFLPTVLGGSFWTQFSPKIAMNATTAGLFMVSVATSSPCAEAETTQFIKHQPGAAGRAALPPPRPSRDPSGSEGSVPLCPGLWHWYPPLPAATEAEFCFQLFHGAAALGKAGFGSEAG